MGREERSLPKIPTWRNRMPLKVMSNNKKEFVLKKSDNEFSNKGEPTKVTIRQATQGDFEIRNDLFAEFKREYDGTAIRVIQRISFDDIRRKEVFLTLCECNILDDQDGDEPKELFSFKDGRLTNEREFLSAWSKLHPSIANEIHEYVLEQNPLWKPEGEA
jgi:hypothetical protein